MKQKVGAGVLGWLLVAGTGFVVYHELSKQRSRLATSGAVMLEAGVPYRLTYQSRDVLMMNPTNETVLGRQEDVRDELQRLGAYDVAFMKRAGLIGGEYLVSFALTPPISTRVTVGTQLAPTGVYSTGLKLLEVERLDGKPL